MCPRYRRGIIRGSWCIGGIQTLTKRSPPIFSDKPVGCMGHPPRGRLAFDGYFKSLSPRGLTTKTTGSVVPSARMPLMVYSRSCAREARDEGMRAAVLPPAPVAAVSSAQPFSSCSEGTSSPVGRIAKLRSSCSFELITLPFPLFQSASPSGVPPICTVSCRQRLCFFPFHDRRMHPA